MNIAVIFAGGVGQRMHSRDVPKQFLEMHKKPIIIYTLEIFDNHPEIDAIVIACKEEWISYLEKLIYKFRIEKVKKKIFKWKYYYWLLNRLILFFISN